MRKNKILLILIYALFLVGCLNNKVQAPTIDKVEKVEILVNGSIFESEHVMYDTPLTKYE